MPAGETDQQRRCAARIGQRAHGAHGCCARGRAGALALHAVCSAVCFPRPTFTGHWHGHSGASQGSQGWAQMTLIADSFFGTTTTAGLTTSCREGWSGKQSGEGPGGMRSRAEQGGAAMHSVHAVHTCRSRRGWLRMSVQPSTAPAALPPPPRVHAAAPVATVIEEPGRLVDGSFKIWGGK